MDHLERHENFGGEVQMCVQGMESKRKSCQETPNFSTSEDG
jgi:hypothetical protein